MNNLIFLAPLLIVIMLPAIMFLISRFGWAKLSARFRCRGGFQGERVGIISAAVNTANYKNSLVLKYNRDGLYLKAVFIFRLFHPPVLIPWAEIMAIRDQDARFGTVTEIEIGQPEIATITVMQATFAKISAAYQQYGARI